MRSWAARVTAVVAALTAVVTTACSSAVAGHGSTAAAGAGSVSTSSGAVAPSGFPSIGSGGSGSAGPSGPAAAGVSFAFPAGHFRATFPAQPQTSSEPGTVSGASYTLFIAQAEADNEPTLLACEEISVRLPADQYDETLRGAVGGFEGSSGLTLTDQRSTQFRGHVARLAHFTSPHGAFTFLATMFTDQRLYLFFGPTGAPYDTLTSSFQPL
jgi:hypothetical protein